MSITQRLAIVAGAVAALVAGFVILSPGEDSPAPSSTATEAGSETGKRKSTTTATPAPVATTPAQPAPVTARIRIRGGQAVGGARSIKAERGDRVRIAVTSDAATEAHLHGYDIERAVAPGEPATLSFRANLEGIFALEDHHSEAVLAKVVVAPR